MQQRTAEGSGDQQWGAKLGGDWQILSERREVRTAPWRKLLEEGASVAASGPLWLLHIGFTMGEDEVVDLCGCFRLRRWLMTSWWRRTRSSILCSSDRASEGFLEEERAGGREEVELAEEEQEEAVWRPAGGADANKEAEELEEGFVVAGEDDAEDNGEEGEAASEGSGRDQA